MKGLDLSFAQPSQAWWNKRYAEGWRVMVQDAWTGQIRPVPTLINLNRALTAGFVTAAYVVVNDLPGATAVDQARFACGAEWDYLNFVAVDVEVATSTAAVKDALAAIRWLGKKTCIYTSRNAWKVVGSTTAFKSEWLWNAYYDGDPDHDFFLNQYGGFTKLAGEQYRGTTNLDGYNVDLNDFSAAFINEGSQEDMDEATVKRIAAEVVADLLYTRGPGHLPNVLDEVTSVALEAALGRAVERHTDPFEPGLRRGDTVKLV